MCECQCGCVCQFVNVSVCDRIGSARSAGRWGDVRWGEWRGIENGKPPRRHVIITSSSRHHHASWGMDFFRSGLKSVLGTPEPGEQPTGADIVRPKSQTKRQFSFLSFYFSIMILLFVMSMQIISKMLLFGHLICSIYNIYF